MYLDVLEAARWRLPTLQSAAKTKSPITGPSGVKMSGPYSFVPANYWMNNSAPGWADNFLTEGGPGEF